MVRRLNPQLLCALGAALALGAIFWAESQLWQGVTHLRQEAETVSSSNFHLSESLEARLRELHEGVFRQALEQATGGSERLVSEGAQLQVWLREQQEAPVNPPQRALLELVSTAVTNYLNQATRQLQRPTNGAPARAWTADDQKHFEVTLRHTRELAQVERRALAEHLEETRHTTRLLQGRLILSSVVLLTMGASLVGLVYAGLIVPLRKRLHQAQQAMLRQEKLGALGVMAAGVAHEIRNPLTSIKARLYTQKSQLTPGSEACEDNVFITEEISRLEKIVKDFLAFARPSDPHLTPVAVSRIFANLTDLIRPALERSGIRLELKLEADPVVQADPQQLQQVLLNLVQNAAESIGQDGVITLRATLPLPSTRRLSPPSAMVEVCDNGPGIPRDVQERLFDPFFTTKPSGTGLGLSIAARILEKHAGRLEHVPQSGRGTTFRLHLPIAPSLPAPPASA